MSERCYRKCGGRAVSKPKPPAPGQETDDVFSRAKKGDESCLPEVRALLADGEVRPVLSERVLVRRPSGSAEA